MLAVTELKPRKKDSPRTTVSLPAELADRLRRFAEAKQVTMGSAMAVALDEWLRKQRG
jgi:hypothetical protein